MKKVITLFAAAMMLCTMSFAQKAENTTVLKSTRFVPAKLTKDVANNGPKVSGNPVWDNTMSYCLDADFDNSVGTGTTDGSIYWAIKIESAALAGRDNLTDVDFFVYAAGSYTLQIFSGVEPTGTALHTQSVTATNADTMTWKNIHFNTPLPINQNQDLWVVMSATGVEYPASSVAPNEYDNGKWISIDGVEWELITDEGIDATWMIHAISDTYIVLPPMVSLQGPTAVREGDTVYYIANSGNADSFTWTVNADYLDNTIDNVIAVVWETAGPQQVIVMASNDAGDTYDTLDVDVFSCNNIELPYIPNFANGLGCWSSRSDSTDGTGWFASVDMYESDPEGQVLSISAQSMWGMFMIDVPTDNWLFSPVITMPSNGVYEIAWQVKPLMPNYAGDHYGVYVISGTDTTLLFEESLTGMNDYTQRVAVVPSTVSGDIQVAFRHFNSEGGYVIVLDDIQIRNLTAPQVTLVGPSEVENGTAATFVANAPNADSFEWAIDGVAVSANGNTLTNTFTEDGFYTISVMASNSEGNSEDTLVVEVYTCSDINVFPYTQNFENGIRCWSMVSADPANDDRFGVYEDENAFDGNYDFRFSSFSRAEDYNQYLISPELTFPDGEYLIKFDYSAHSGTESFRVLASTTTNDLAAFTNVLGTFENTNSEWTEVAFLLPEGTKYIAINYYANYMYYLYVDNITINELNMAPIVELEGPASVEVNENITIVANAPLANSFAWTVDGVAVNTTGNTLTTSFATVGNHTVSVTATNNIGSTPATKNIEVYSCDVTSLPYNQGFEDETAECWTLSEKFAFLNNPDYAHSGTNLMYCTYDDYADLDEWAISPAIHMPADASNIGISWYVLMLEYEGIQNTYEVRVSTTGRNPEDFTTVLFSETGASDDFVQRGWNLANFGGQTIYIAFHNISVAGGDAILFDDIYVGTGVGIEDVDNVNVSVYPNPANDVLNIEGEGIQNVELLDVNGRTVLTNANGGSLNISNLATGVYVVRVITNNGISTQKIVKK